MGWFDRPVSGSAEAGRGTPESSARMARMCGATALGLCVLPILSPLVVLLALAAVGFGFAGRQGKPDYRFTATLGLGLGIVATVVGFAELVWLW